MADASDTMRYLVKHIDIAPAGTREEGQAAKSLSEVFHEHGLETANKSFRFSSFGKVAVGALAGVAGIAGILSGIGSGVLPIVMFVLGLAATVLYFLEMYGVHTVTKLGVTSSSQNVVARHPAATSAGQKARPVVIIAHYDTPRADLLATPALAPVQPYLRMVVSGCFIANAVAMLLQLIPFPAVVHSIAWAVSIVASIVLVLWCANALMQRFVMPFTVGANDNKASVAALFGVLDRVRPLQGGPGFGPDDALIEADELARNEAEMGALLDGEDPAVTSVRRRPRVEESVSAMAEEPVAVRPAAPRAVRYGADVVRSLGILPESCVIEYDDGNSAHVHRASDAYRDDRGSQELEVIEGATMVIPMAAAAEEPASIPAEETSVAAVVEASPEDEKDAAADAIMANIVGTNTLSGSHAPQVSPASMPAPAAATSLMTPVAAEPAVAPQPQMAPQQPFRVITSSDDYDVELLNTPAAMPPDVAEQSAQISTSFTIDDPDSFSASLVNDPSWGTATFTPVSAERRILSDIPDPAVAAVDPFSVTSIEPVGGYNPEDFSQLDFETGTHQAVTPHMLESERRRALDGFSAEITDSPKRGRKSKKRQGRISHQAARMQAEMQEESFNDWLGLDENFDAKTSGQEIGSWDNFADDPGFASPNGSQQNGRWQGGAARARRTPRRSMGEASDREVRRAAMTLGDRDLIAHEIWFVLTGASEGGHAGIEDFLQTYRNDLRGAYFVNLECVGAGRESLVIEEGLGRHTKADRRLVNLFGQASLGINRPLALTRMDWRDTEATPLLRQGCRAVTVCGVERGVPAHARWVGDTPEKVDIAMIDDIVDVVVEVIKNA